MAESKNHDALLEAQSFFHFAFTAWTKVGTPSVYQLNTVGKAIDSNVHLTGLDSDRGAWRRFYEKNTTEMEDECRRSLIGTKDSLARDHEECTTHLKRKQSNAIEECKTEMRQNSSEAIVNLAEDTIGNILATVSRTFRGNMKSIVKERLATRVNIIHER